MSAVYRSVHVWAARPRPTARPLTSEFSTPPPPYESPQPPMLFASTSGRAPSQERIARMSETSRGPSIPTSPPDCAVAARVEGQDRVVLPDETVRVASVFICSRFAGEPVQEDDRRPARGGRRAVGQVERRRDRDAVVHRDRDVLPREVADAARLADEEDEDEGGASPVTRPSPRQGREGR